MTSTIDKLLSPLGICQTQGKASHYDLDSYFSSLIDLLPPDCYFETEALAELKNVAATSSSRFKSQQHHLSSSKISEASTVTQCAELLELGEKYKAENLNARTRLQNRIKQFETKRKANDSINLKKEKRREKKEDKKRKKKPANHKTFIQSNNSTLQNGFHKKGEAVPMFSRFNFMNGDGTGDTQKDKKRKMSKEQLLKISEQQAEKMETLRQQDGAVAQQLESKEAWQKALDKARGVKVKDDPKFLRKAIRKEHSLKRRSARQWSERQKQEQAKQNTRQEKRQRNLEKARAMKVKKKMKRAVSKGRILPGF